MGAAVYVHVCCVILFYTELRMRSVRHVVHRAHGVVAGEYGGCDVMGLCLLWHCAVFQAGTCSIDK